jgi:hypothetical protein
MSLDVIFAWAFGLSAVGLWSVAHAQLGRRRIETDAGLRLVVLDGVVLGLIALALVSEAAFYELMQEDGPAE